MTIFIDTNVFLDIFLMREPFLTYSEKALRIIFNNFFEAMFCVSSVTDLFYIVRKRLHSYDLARQKIEQLEELVVFADVKGSDVEAALKRNMPDFEDALVDVVATRYKADFILTRNIRDFANSETQAVTPKEFVSMFS